MSDTENNVEDTVEVVRPKKSKKEVKIRISMTIKPSVHKALKKLAEDKGKSVSSLIEQILAAEVIK